MSAPAPDPAERQAHIETLAELVEDIRICMLTTVDPDGTPWSRPMGLPEADLGSDK